MGEFLWDSVQSILSNIDGGFGVNQAEVEVCTCGKLINRIINGESQDGGSWVFKVEATYGPLVSWSYKNRLRLLG